MRILSIQNAPAEDLGLYEAFARHAGHDVEHVDAWRECGFPRGRWDAILVGGTPIGAGEAAAHGFLRHELAFLEGQLDARTPVLGLCCGGQLVAGLLGGRARSAETPEVGMHEITLTGAGRQDPLLEGFPDRFWAFQWHRDTFEVPPGGALLATGSPCAHQAFRRGPAVGLTFHLELTIDAAGRWADAYPDELTEAGLSRDELLAACAPHAATMRRLAARLVANFLSLSRSGVFVAP